MALSDPDGMFEAISGRGAPLVAVSGGPDSMALLHLARDWARRRGLPLHAATVDHGLRPESASEAASVGRWAADLGVCHAVLPWLGERPASRIQERARQARYALLFAHARQIGAGVVLTAHHADDQAETILFRLLRGSSLHGLAGMQRLVPRGDLWLGRPLLDLAKQDLIAICETRRQPYIEDVSNSQDRFARVRMRKLLKLLAEEGLQPGDLLRLAQRARRLEVALQAAEPLFAPTGVIRDADSLTCDATPLRDAPLEFVLRFLMREIGSLSRAVLRLDGAERLAQRVAQALEQQAALRVTLAGVWVQLRADGRLRLSPEPRRRSGTITSDDHEIS